MKVNCLDWNPQTGMLQELLKSGERGRNASEARGTVAFKFATKLRWLKATRSFQESLILIKEYALNHTHNPYMIWSTSTRELPFKAPQIPSSSTLETSGKKRSGRGGVGQWQVVCNSWIPHLGTLLAGTWRLMGLVNFF